MSKAWDWFKARSLIAKIIIVVVAIGVIGNIFGGGDPVAEEVEAAPATTTTTEAPTTTVVETTTTTEAPTTTTVVVEPPDEGFRSVDEMREHLEAGGIVCDSWNYRDPNEYSIDSADCQGDLMLAIYESSEMLEAQAEVRRGLLGPLGMVDDYVRGETWMVNCSGQECDSVQEILGGEIVREEPPEQPDVEASDFFAETLFLAFVRDWSRDQPLNIIDTASDSMIIDLALSACQVLDEGGSYEDIATVAVLSLAENDSLTDANVEAVGTIIGAGVEAFCPQHSGKLG